MAASTAPPQLMACPLCAFPVPPAAINASSGHYRHCRECDLVFLEPAERLSRDAEGAYYLTHENDVDDPRYRRFLSRLADPLMQRLSPGAEGLDFGAGPGPALAAMLRENGFPTAIHDPFFAPGGDVLDHSYDFIACTEVIEHLHRPGREFALFDTLLRSGGLLGLMTHLRTMPLESFPDWYYHRDPTHVCFYSENTVRWIARRFRWQSEHVDERVILLRKP